jgi:hypothetical protein
VLSDDEDMEVDATILEREETIRSVFFSRALPYLLGLGTELRLNWLVLGSPTEKICLLLRKSAVVLRKRRRKRERVVIDFFLCNFFVFGAMSPPPAGHPTGGRNLTGLHPSSGLL